jgi:phage terminase large subunit
VTTATYQIPYAPLPKQQAAHRLAAKYRGFCGGWGNGKTSWGCVETFIALHEFPGINWIIARKTRPELRATTWDMFLNGDTGQEHGWHGIPRELIASNNKSDLHVVLRNGSQVFGLPLDDPKKIENYNLGGFWIDQAEEVEEDIFLKFHGRLRQKHAPREGLLTFNPAGHNWLWRRMIDPKRPDEWKRQYKCIEATTYDNPNLPDDFFDQFEGLPDAWVQRFVYGSHDVFVGQIFTDYNDERHVVQPFHIPESWERWMCIDPGIGHEGAVSWCARDFDGNAYYYRELLAKGQPVEWWAQQVHEIEARADYGGPNEKIHRRLIGLEANQRSQRDGKTVLSKWNEFGIYPEFADRDPSARISSITEYLRPKPGNRDPWTGADASPRLRIFADCEKLQEYLPQYRWKPQRTNYSEEEPAEKPRKKDDHNIDNLGHMLLAFDGLPELDAPRTVADAERAFLDEHFDATVAAANTERYGVPHPEFVSLRRVRQA